jgi:hypothetical protein
MEKVTRRRQTVLDVLDEQIEELEQKLIKVQPLIDELATLRRTRATLLDERRPTGGGGNRRGTILSLEQVVHFLDANGPSTPIEIATALGVNDNMVRSHLNRYLDQRYAKNGEGKWRLIGEGVHAHDEAEEDEGAE